jgi:hypothetical protein
MDDILRPFTNSFMVVCLDGILVFNKTWEEHLKHIQQVLGTFQQHNLYANLENYSFHMKRIQYLGYIVDEQGVHVDLDKIQVIHDWPTPKTMIKLHSFLGLVNFCHWFMLGFSRIAWALIQVTKGGVKSNFVWVVSQ